MGETPKRSGFRLRWGDSSESGETRPATESTPAPESASEGATPEPLEAVAKPAPEAPAESATSPEPTPFLRDLVEAMRGVAESSRDSNLAQLRSALDQRIEELRSGGEQRAEDLRRRSEQDVAGIGEWERAEIERLRAEAEQRRDARRAQLEREIADHQAAVDGDMESARRRLADYERELAAFFSDLTQITDPAAFVSAAKRMPPPPDLQGESGAGNASRNGTASAAGYRSESVLSERLAELDQQLAPTETTAAPGAPTDAATAPVKQAAEPQPAPAGPPPAATAPATAASDSFGPSVESATSTPIVVKGLGSFGAITSFKQALERVDGVKGVTLSLGPTGEFVYRASHQAEFDIVAAIRQIEGEGAGIQHSEGQVLVTIERPR